MKPVEWQMRLEPTTQAPRAARVFVSQHLEDLGYSKLVDDAALIVDELVTNSVREAPPMSVWVVFRQVRTYLLLEVWDCSPDPPVFQDPDFLATEGRGLHIVAELSIRLGWDIFPWGKVVWVLLG